VRSALRLPPKEGGTVRTRGRACLLVLLLAAGAASADTFTVTSTADTDDGTCDADCTLREAINAANGNMDADIIDFSVAADSTITLGSPLANIDGDLDIDGTTATNLTVSDSGGFPIFQVGTGTTTVSGVTITGLDLAIAMDAKATFDLAAAGVYADDLSGAGAFEKLGAGQLSLSGTNDYTGGTTISEGSLNVSFANLPNGGPVVVGNGAQLIFTEDTVSVSNLFSGDISGGGSVTKEGAGSLGLIGTNSYGGGTVVNAGTLGVSPLNLPIGGAVTLNNDSILIFAELVGGVENTFSGVISGTGSLQKFGDGTVVLTGANSYEGGTLVLGGTLKGDSDSLKGDFTISVGGAMLVFDQASDGTFAGVIDGLGPVEKDGDGTLVFTGANTYSGGTTVTKGTLQGDTTSLPGNFDIGVDGTLTFDQATAGSYDGVFSGTGALQKSGDGALTVTADSSGFTGMTTLSAGGLQLTGTLGGAVLVETMTLLGGTGRIDGTLTSNGTVSPGPPGEIGTLSVQDAVLDDGSFLEVDVDEGGVADLLDVTDTATINGAEVVIRLGEGGFETAVPAEILRSTTLAGEGFAPLSDDFAFLDTTLSVVGSSVFLTVVDNGATFETFAKTRNQRAVAKALDDSEEDASGDYEDVLDELRQLSASELPRAYDRMSGEQLTMFFTPRLAARDRFSRMVDARLRGFASKAPYAVARSGDTGGGGLALASLPRPGLPGFALGAAGAAGIGATFIVGPEEGGAGPGGWLDGYGIFGDVDGDSGQTDVDYEVYGTSLGIDFRPSESWIFGAAGGYARIDANFDGRNGEAKADTGRGALYAAYAHDLFYLGASAGGGYGDFETKRKINFGTINRRAKADFDGWDVSAHGEVGITALSLGGVHIDPIASLDYTRLKQDSFEETGAGSLDLDTKSEIVNSLVSGVGARIHGTFSTEREWRMTPELRVAWTHEFEDKDRQVRTAFSGASTGGSFSVEGAELSRDSLVAGAGYVVSGPQGLNLYAGYDFRWNPDGLEHGVGIGLQFAW
jgi:CSLREA domain-containing protein